MSPFTCSLLLACLAAGPDDYKVLPADKQNPPEQMLHRYLVREAHQALDRRRAIYEKLQTKEECLAYQQKHRAFFLKQLGGFPKRTPLNGRVAGRLDGGNYRVEKIIYESRPHHHVTAALYLPKTKPPYPAVLIACGHTKSGKAAGYNQRMGILLAQNGIAAMCYDPIGQGERSQILTKAGKPKFTGSTSEHFLMGVGSILVGTNTAQYRTFDGIRGIDYLISRSDIMADKIGCTGCSGGGTLTSYIMALDDRVACAAPACYLTTWRRLIDTIGPQDSEQNIFGQVGFGMDHPDYVMMRAPRPTLILSSTRDFFDIEGTWDNFRQSKRFYGRFGFAERVNLVEVDAKHGVTKTSRIAMVRWMRRWLLGKDSDVVEKEPKLWTEAELRCTPDGEVLRLPGERSVFDLNRQRHTRLSALREKFWAASNAKEKRAKIRQIARIAPLEKLPHGKVHVSATVKKKTHQMMKLSIETAKGIKVPALMFVPDRANGKLTLLVSGKGKASSIAQVEKLVERGRTVLTIDVRGIGETASAGRANALLGADWKEFYLAYVLGRSMVGMRAEDILVAARYLSFFSEAELAQPVELIADGKAAVAALHAAALEPRTFASISVGDAAQTWNKILQGNEPQDQFVNTVHNALRWYDLPKLQALAKSK